MKYTNGIRGHFFLWMLSFAQWTSRGLHVHQYSVWINLSLSRNCCKKAVTFFHATTNAIKELVIADLFFFNFPQNYMNKSFRLSVPISLLTRITIFVMLLNTKNIHLFFRYRVFLVCSAICVTAISNFTLIFKFSFPGPDHNFESKSKKENYAKSWRCTNKLKGANNLVWIRNYANYYQREQFIIIS